VGNSLLKVSIIAFLIFSPIISSIASNKTTVTVESVETTDFSVQTSFNITDACLTYNIQSGGDYGCAFLLQVIGNEHTSAGNLNGSFKIEDREINSINMRFAGVMIDCTLTQLANYTVCSFTIDQELHPGNIYELSGYFQGIYQDDRPGIYNYHLGIDWGTLAGYQETTIRLDDRVNVLVLPIEPEYPHQINHTLAHVSELKWIHAFVTGFTVNLNLLLKNLPNTYLAADIDSWNASTGQSNIIVGPNRT